MREGETPWVPGSGPSWTVAARKARVLGCLMERPAPRTTPPAVPNGPQRITPPQLFLKPYLFLFLLELEFVETVTDARARDDVARVTWLGLYFLTQAGNVHP